MMSSNSPPPVPVTCIYTSRWCEENIYNLVREFLQYRDYWTPFAVFISNATRTVSLWSQKLAQSPDDAVIWDYHVVLLLVPKGSSKSRWIYDFDSMLTLPCDWDEYFSETFSPNVPPPYQSQFRVVPGQLFIDCFASDRSHMLAPNADLTYLSPPPPYPPIRGRRAMEVGIEDNLMDSYVSMQMTTEGIYGRVFELDDFLSWCSDRSQRVKCDDEEL